MHLKQLFVTRGGETLGTISDVKLEDGTRLPKPCNGGEIIIFVKGPLLIFNIHCYQLLLVCLGRTQVRDDVNHEGRWDVFDVAGRANGGSLVNFCC